MSRKYIRSVKIVRDTRVAHMYGVEVTTVHGMVVRTQGLTQRAAVRVHNSVARRPNQVLSASVMHIFANYAMECDG